MTNFLDYCEFQEGVFDAKKIEFIPEINNGSEISNKKKETKDSYDNSNSTYFTDSQYLVKSITNRKKNKYNENSKKLMGRKREIENYNEIKKSKIDESNVRRKILTHFQDFLYHKLKKKVKKISYKIYTRESINYLKNVFKMKIFTFFKQKVNEKGKNKPNDEILNKLMKNPKKRSFLERNFLEVFYNDFIKILDKDYLNENNIDEEEFEIWKKIIYYKPKKKKTEYKNEYEKYGFYQYIYEKKERKAQNEYKLIEKIFEIEKIKKNKNSDIKIDNSSNNDINYSFNNSEPNNNGLNNIFPSDSFDLFNFNSENKYTDEIFDFENIEYLGIYK